MTPFMGRKTAQTHLENRLTRELAAVCRAKLLEEKWLIAPSLRVGYQWLERVAACGTPVVNARVMTVRSLAVRLAKHAIKRSDLKILPGSAGPIIVDRILARLTADESYILSQQPGPGLAAAIDATIRDLRLAGVTPEELEDGRFEVALKASEIRAFLTAWEEELEACRFVDQAGFLSMALRELETGSYVLPAGLSVLLPEDTQLFKLEHDLVKAFPPETVKRLPFDEPDHASPQAEGTIRIFSAIGEVGEVKHVLRYCLAQGIPFDHVEIVHTSTETYLPLIFETFAALADKPENFEDEIPVTFAEGVPARFMRPGRALAAWVSWVLNDFPQQDLATMIREGLLAVPNADNPVERFELAAELAKVPIGLERDRYLPALRDSLKALDKSVDIDRREEDGEDGSSNDDIPQRRARLDALINLVEHMLDSSPERNASQGDVLNGAMKFIEKCARAVTRFDFNTRNKINQEIEFIRDCLAGRDSGGLDVWEWLIDLPGEVRVEGSAPKKGCLHVSRLSAGGSSGGHSGRPHTFVIGLDDGRYPGGGRQDPLLLDNERSRISGGLLTADERLNRKTIEFDRLLARLRGAVHLGYACRDLMEDRELFPSPKLLEVFRTQIGNPNGDRSALENLIGSPASFVPGKPEEALDRGDWWSWRLCGDVPVKDPEKLVHECHPHLARGAAAANARGDVAFTDWDGHVPLANTTHDPLSEDGPVVSASRLEKLGECPRAYFYRYVLRIEPPEKIEIDRSVWLDHMAYGSLMHDVFHRFMGELIEAGDLPPSFKRDHGRLEGILERTINQYAERYPVINKTVFDAQVRELEKAARNFLRSEEVYGALGQALYLEASVGMPSYGGGTRFDSADPAVLNLGGGRKLRARGRIDRIDRIISEEGDVFALWDYKSGSPGKYAGIKAFGGGRILQHALYSELARRRLRETVAPGALIESFGYFFPGVRGQGVRLEWSIDQLADWKPVAVALCEVVRQGAFLTTGEGRRCNHCDFRPACGVMAAGGGHMLEDEANEALVPLRELEEYE